MVINLKNRKSNILYIIYGLLIFTIMYIFYTSIEPMLVVDPDDWTYIGTMRVPLPLWNAWNPAKVFLEFFVGLLGYFSAYVVYPMCNDYIFSFTYTFAFFSALFVSLYMLGICIICEKLIRVDKRVSICISFVSFCMHFLLFRQKSDEVSPHMFTAITLNRFINYMVPTLLCMIIAIWLIICFVEDNNMDNIIAIIGKGNKSENIKVFLLSICIYFAVFSNMACNIVYITISNSIQ